jgi:hypothetical protein
VAIAYGEVSVEMVSSSTPPPGAMPHAKRTKIELRILWVSKYVIFVNWLCQAFPFGPATSEANNK